MTTTATSRVPGLERLDAALAVARPQRTGRVGAVVGLSVEVEGLDGAIGDALSIETPGGPLAAEVVAASGRGLVCLPYGELAGVARGAAVRRPIGGGPGQVDLTVPIGPSLLGRVLDGLGRPIDGGPPLDAAPRARVDHSAPHPLRRSPVDRPLSLGVRVLDTLVPCGRGQRLGIFAGSGVGKSTLLSMIARGTTADVSVLALVGERGREVGEFLTHDLGAEGLARSVVVVATGDEPALLRRRAALTATRIAEGFRDEGRDVVLMMDSVTRFCMAQREVGLSAGEPPATRGYPPSVFSLLPRLLERAGTSEHGSITGLYTVLVDGDDMNEPISDAARSILDGHIVLSRRLATAGHYPCVDVLESVSRVAPRVTDDQQRELATRLRSLLAAKRDAQDLIEVGAYVPGTNPLVDRANELAAGIDAFLRQESSAVADAGDSWRRLGELVG